MISCRGQKVDLPKNLEGYLLLIEDLDGEGGSMDGDFSDIVLYEPNTKARYLITEDDYFDYSPSYSSTLNKIVFESKRVNANNSLGLSNKSHFFLYDLKNNDTEQLTNKNFIERLKEITEYFQIGKPVFDEKGSKICFYYTDFFNDDYINNYAIFDLSSSKIENVITNNRRLSKHIYQSAENCIYYDCLPEPMNPRYSDIRKMDITNNDVEILIKKNGSIIWLCDIQQDKILYLSKDTVDYRPTYLRIYDLIEKKDIYEVTNKELNFLEITNPVFGKNTDEIYMVGRIKDNNREYNEDVYLLDTSTRKIKRITETFNIKENLVYCRKSAE